MATATSPNNPIDWASLTSAYEQGASDVEIAKMLNLTAAKFYKLYESNPAFANFVDSGRTLAQAWWYEAGRKHLMTKGFNVSLYNFIMKNRFGWADKVESADTTDKDNLNLDELRAQVSSALKRLAQNSPELLSNVNLTHLPKQKDGDD